jgi:hypothetical protein
MLDWDIVGPGGKAVSEPVGIGGILVWEGMRRDERSEDVTYHSG